MKISRAQALILLLISLTLSACSESGQKSHDRAQKITVITLQSNPVTVTQPYVCHISSHHHVEVRAPEAGHLGAVQIKEGQMVKRDDELFQVKPFTGKEKPGAENETKTISIKAPFDGLVDLLPRHQGSTVQKSEPLTTLFDNSLMWVSFKVPEARYLEYKSANLDQHKDDLKIELVLANGNKFDHLGKLGAIGADFSAGTVAFRADFPNPEHLLRHGQTGTVLISQVQNDALVIPQQATFQVLNKSYVYVVDKDDVAHQREIVIQKELEDNVVVKTGISVNDKVVIEGIRLIHDGDKIEYKEHQAKKVVANLKSQME